MTQTDEQASRRLQRMSEEVHIDAAHYPDPCGTGLLVLVGAIESHISEEQASIEAYRQLAGETRDPVVAALMRLLVEDEERHHRMFEEIGKTLRDRFFWQEDAPAQMTDGAGTLKWLRRVHTLEADEQRGARALRELAHRAHSQGEPLVRELLDAMAIDSDKHARLLRVVGQRLTRAQVR